jgi:hypothetical protein
VTVLHLEPQIFVSGPHGLSAGRTTCEVRPVLPPGHPSLLFLDPVLGEVVAPLVEIEIEEIEPLLQYGFLVQILQGALQTQNEIFRPFGVYDRCKTGSDDEHQYG